MDIKCMVVGPIGANCYVVSCPETKETAIIDPGGDAKRILAYIAENDLQVKYIINTHGHIDHISADDELREPTGAQLLIHAAEASMLQDTNGNLSAFMGGSLQIKPADRQLNEGDEIKFGTLTFKVLHTPGHTPGGMCLVGEGVVFTGDTLFAGSIGRTDFPGGSFDQIIDSIKTKLLILPGETSVLPGHMGSSTIANEKRLNPFLA